MHHKQPFISKYVPFNEFQMNCLQIFTFHCAVEHLVRLVDLKMLLTRKSEFMHPYNSAENLVFNRESTEVDLSLLAFC